MAAKKAAQKKRKTASQPRKKRTKKQVKKKPQKKGTTKVVAPPKDERLLTPLTLGLMALLILLTLFNQFGIAEVNALATTTVDKTVTTVGEKDLSAVDLNTLQSTGHTIAAVFPVEDITTSDDAMAIMFPQGTPDYGADLGVTYDDPVTSLDVLAKMYRPLKAEVEKSDPEAWQRYLDMATKPVGISCEYCCGIGPLGIDDKGNSRCGCAHNPGVLSVALYLTAYTDYTDGEILREVMRWKTLFFPRNMIEIGMTVAGGDTSALDNLPGMVGGC